MKRVRVEFIQPPKGLTEALQDTKGVLEQAAAKIAAKAEAISPVGTKYDTYIRQIKFGQDAAYGITRPAAVVETDDLYAYRAEAMNKTLLQAVGEK